MALTKPSFIAFLLSVNRPRHPRFLMPLAIRLWDNGQLAQQWLGHRVVQAVGRGDVDRLDGVVGEHLLEARAGLRQAQRPGRLPRLRLVHPQDASHGNPRAPQPFDVHGSDEAGADHSGGDVGHGLPPAALAVGGAA
jgi:hypothetical protein